MKKLNASKSTVASSKYLQHAGLKDTAPALPDAQPESATVRLPDDALLHAAYDRVAPEFGALTPEQLATVNLDVSNAVEIVLEAMPRILALRERLAALAEFDIGCVDRLTDYAYAVWYANQLCDVGHEVVESLPELAARLTTVRDELQLAAQFLARRRLIPAADLAALRGGTGYSDIAHDVISLVLMYRNAWPALRGRSMITVDELDEAIAQAHRLALGVSHRDHAPSVPTEPSRNRQRAFTLLMRAYEEVRRGVGYLCAKTGDADTVAPSFFTRGTRYTSPKPAETPAVTSMPRVAAPPAPVVDPRSVPQDDPFGRT